VRLNYFLKEQTAQVNRLKRADPDKSHMLPRQRHPIQGCEQIFPVLKIKMGMSQVSPEGPRWQSGPHDCLFQELGPGW
jgi:hypothetical protein